MNILPSDSESEPAHSQEDGVEGLLPEDSSDHGPFHVVCAWCKGVIPKRVLELGQDGVSHGICRPCASRHFGVTLPGGG